MIIGITGTRHSLTAAQKRGLAGLLCDRGVEELHHGDCVGADAFAHALAMLLEIRVVIHPPEDDLFRAFCKGAAASWYNRPFLERNRNIVDSCDRLIALPNTEKEVQRSGTWATYRYAKKQDKSRVILYPSGAVSVSWGNRE